MPWNRREWRGKEGFHEKIVNSLKDRKGVRKVSFKKKNKGKYNFKNEGLINNSNGNKR